MDRIQEQRAVRDQARETAQEAKRTWEKVEGKLQEDDAKLDEIINLLIKAGVGADEEAE